MTDTPPSNKSAALTTTKLFTLGDEGSWTEIGVGTASIQYEPCNADVADGGTTELTPKLVIESVEDDTSEVLLSTPVCTDDIYQVQKGTILVWTDPELARDMAASFHSAEGCRSIVDQITRYQAEHNAHREPLRSSDASNDASAEDLSPWAVSKRNLPALVMAVTENKQRFIAYFKSNPQFCPQLVALFNASRHDGDLESQQRIAAIVCALLSRPFSTDNKVVGPLVEEDVIEHTVDIVQVHLGRHDEQSGFLSIEARRSKFRNPASLPFLLTKRAHFIAELQTLRDLLPLQLEEGDAGTMGMLAMYSLRLKYELLCDVCDPRVFGNLVPAINDDAETFMKNLDDVVPMLHDLTSTIKNSALPLEPKETLLGDLIGNGVLSIAADAFRGFFRVDAEGVTSVRGDVERAQRLLGRIADVIGGCAAFASRSTRRALFADALEANKEGEGCLSLLEYLLVAIATIDHDVAQQSFADALQLITQGLQSAILLQSTQGRDPLGGALTVFLVSGHLDATCSAPQPPIHWLIQGLRLDCGRSTSRRRAAYCARALGFICGKLTNVVQSLPDHCRSRFGRLLLEDGLDQRIVDVLRGSQDATATTMSVDGAPYFVPITTRVAAMQLLTALIANESEHTPLSALAERPHSMAAIAAVVADELSQALRRKNIVFGAVSSIVSNLCSAADAPQDGRGSETDRTRFCRQFARLILDAPGSCLATRNPTAFLALQVVAQVVPCQGEAAREQSLESDRIGASRPQVSPGDAAEGGSSPTTHNPFLPHRSRSRPPSSSPVMSIDEEYQVLMQEFGEALAGQTVAPVDELDGDEDGAAAAEEAADQPLKRTRSEQLVSPSP